MIVDKGGNGKRHNHGSSREHVVPRESNKWSSNNDRFYQVIEQRILQHPSSNTITEFSIGASLGLA